MFCSFAIVEREWRYSAFGNLDLVKESANILRLNMLHLPSKHTISLKDLTTVAIQNGLLPYTTTRLYHKGFSSFYTSIRSVDVCEQSHSGLYL